MWRQYRRGTGDVSGPECTRANTGQTQWVGPECRLNSTRDELRGFVARQTQNLNWSRFPQHRPPKNHSQRPRRLEAGQPKCIRCAHQQQEERSNRAPPHPRSNRHSHVPSNVLKLGPEALCKGLMTGKPGSTPLSSTPAAINRLGHAEVLVITNQHRLTVIAPPHVSFDN
ncbi:hypothetical protein BD779DRAFT_281555 [Infundibulicybe gibba]|nr:hypothetical protein BD779DRAFT_281555 [Infundibulicybe gibba]